MKTSQLVRGIFLGLFLWFGTLLLFSFIVVGAGILAGMLFIGSIVFSWIIKDKLEEKV
jgi:hypothetical protein